VLRSAVGFVGVVVEIWGEFDATVGAANEGLSDEVKLGVVPAAQHDQVAEGGDAATAPVPQVVNVAPGRRDVAAGPLTVSIADGDRAAHPGGYHSGGPPDVQRL
jgi:hypothetical protein